MTEHHFTEPRLCPDTATAPGGTRFRCRLCEAEAEDPTDVGRGRDWCLRHTAQTGHDRFRREEVTHWQVTPPPLPGP